MTALFGYTDILRYSIKGNEEIHGYIDEIEKVASKASALTQQLLTFSRKQILEPVVIDLNDVVEEMSDMLQRIIGEKIEFKRDLNKDLPLIMADKSGIEQVIVNLAVNSRDAMPNGGVLRIETRQEYLDRIAVAAQPGIVPGEYVLLRVSDTGHGIPRDIRDRVFDPFFTTKADIGGTGLGLSTVFGIVKQTGGFLDVDSGESKGTTIDIYLPAVEGELEPLAIAQEKDLPLGSETILVVEDDPAVRKTVMTILKGAGYKAVEATDGADAIRKIALSNEPFDMIITDIVMPHIDGRELADKIKEANSDIKILYISGYDSVSKQPLSLISKREDFLQKPFTAAHLTRKVREILDK
ncbi:MAG TPA: response regulator [candidate division Zixibacteria bacterium]|nr:response regulator [candidate division Zixibacteria bacterium]